MLISFKVKNFRSFKNEQSFSMEPISIKEHRDCLVNKGKYKLLPLAVFYGANSSGKSNLVRAIKTMRTIIRRSVRLNEGDSLLYDPFALNETSQKEPTLFEITFLWNDVVYRYGFEYNRQEIVSEWLYEKRSGRKKENYLFLRSHDFIDISNEHFPEGEGKIKMTNTNRLFLSLVGQLNGETSNTILGWFSRCNILSGIDSDGYESFTLKMFHDHLDGSDDALQFFQTTQLGFTKFSVKRADLQKVDLEKIPISLRTQLEREIESGVLVESLTTHNVYNEDGTIVGERVFHKDEMESEGTKKIIEMSGPIFDTLKNGKTLIIDEMDAKLHPLLSRNIVLLFMDPKVNINGAQLIFATHDTNLLDLNLIRSDQVWFTEKDKVESTDMYSLVEFKGFENASLDSIGDLRNNYIQGRYGAIPFIGR